MSPNVVREREALGLRKLRHPRITREPEQFVAANTPYFMRVSVKRFQNTYSSATEELVLLRERMLLQTTIHIRTIESLHKAAIELNS